MTDPEAGGPQAQGKRVPDKRDIQSIVADERIKRHDMANEILLVAAEMQNAIDQVRAARESLMGLINMDGPPRHAEQT